MQTGPIIQYAASDPRPMVHSYRRRIASKQCNTVQNTRDLNAWNPECDDNCQALLREDVHTGQSLDPESVISPVASHINLTVSRMWSVVSTFSPEPPEAPPYPAWLRPRGGY